MWAGRGSAYRETVRGYGKAEARFIRQTGGHGQFAVVELSVEPYQPGEGEDHIVFVDDTRGGVISRQYISAVEAGVREAAKGGVLAGYPLINAKVTLLDGKEHPVDSSDLAFENAGMMAFRQACERGGMGLLEPIMRLEVTVPEEYFGVVIGDLHSRRAIGNGHVPSRRSPGHPRPGAAGGDVRLLDPTPQPDAGSGRLADGAVALCSRAGTGSRDAAARGITTSAEC